MKTRDKELLAVGIFGASKLGDRIEMLLKRGRDFSPRASLGRVAVCAAALLGITLAGSRAPRWIAFAQQPDRPSFEVVSVKPGDPSDRRVLVAMQPGGRFTATNATLKMLIGFAYDLRDHQMAGGPSWLGSERYNVEAKADSATPIPPASNGATMRLMAQSFLAERFKLAVHHETKEEQVYELVVAKGGPKLKEATDTAKGPQQGLGMGRGKVNGMAAATSLIARFLSEQLGRSVIDKTGLTGKYDFALTWTPEFGQQFPGGDRPEAPPPTDANGPSIFTAIQEQLGLRLESAKGPVDVLVIDHAEKPDAN
jgi:bla regulator protein BlaR1